MSERKNEASSTKDHPETGSEEKPVLGEKSTCRHCGEPIERFFMPRRNPPGVDGETEMSDDRIAEYGGGDTGWRHIGGGLYYLKCHVEHFRATP